MTSSVVRPDRQAAFITTQHQHIEGDPATLFIPDISGFTNFIHSTEINHSRHIIAELLELLIDANELELEVSEIEGDAILFYRFGEQPDLERVVAQCKRMFFEFHTHLRRYERDRLCDCNACATAHNLSLKILVHSGLIATISIKSFRKLLGKDVIIAHRLLKNNIRSNEYVLLTDEYLNAQRQSGTHVERKTDWLRFQAGSTSYPDVGEIYYSYFYLTPLLQNVSQAPPRSAPRRLRHNVVVSVTIEAPLAFAYTMLTDLSLRDQWVDDVQEVRSDGKIERIGSSHQCVLPAATLFIETLQNSLESQRAEYVERAANMPMIRTAYFFYTMETRGGNTIAMTIEAHFEPTPFGRLITPFMRQMIRKKSQQNAVNFRDLVESRLKRSL